MDPIDFDPYAPTDAIPYQLFADMRARCPVARIPVGWYLSRLDDVVDREQVGRHVRRQLPCARSGRAGGREVRQ